MLGESGRGCMLWIPPPPPVRRVGFDSRLTSPAGDGSADHLPARFHRLAASCRAPHSLRLQRDFSDADKATPLLKLENKDVDKCHSGSLRTESDGEETSPTLYLPAYLDRAHTGGCSHGNGSYTLTGTPRITKSFSVKGTFWSNNNHYLPVI